MSELIQHLLVRALLENPDSRSWTIQGLGVLRTYLAPDVRLHVWDSRYQSCGVSSVHTHPWDLSSVVIAGSVRDFVYEPVLEADDYRLPHSETFNSYRIRCGAGGGIEGGDPESVKLFLASAELHLNGDSYLHAADEIHRSSPADGTVTIVRTSNRDPERRAHVYWPAGEEFGDAVHRDPDVNEVRSICTNSLERWFQ